MAAKSADLKSLFTDAELAKMDPDVVERIRTGIEYATVAAGGKVDDPAAVRAKFEAVKKELLSIPSGTVAPIRTLKP